MAKALIMTVGTGTGLDPERGQRLAQGLVYSIHQQKPERVIFLVTQESERETLPHILQGLGPGLNYEVRRLPRSGNVEEVYRQASECLSGLIAEGLSPHEIALDYTSGTKAMSAGAAIAAATFEVGTLSYVDGQREQGVVIPGTEELRLLRPYRIVIDRWVHELKVMFNRYQFQAALDLLDGLLERVYERALHEELERYRELCAAYLHWDRFNHEEAGKRLELIRTHELDIGANLGFLKELGGRREDPEMFYIADLLNNAERRAEEGGYDDAVARLYRTVELLGQRQLRRLGLIDEEVLRVNRAYKVCLDRLSNRLAPDRLAQMRDRADGRERLDLGLRDSYRLLADLSDELGLRYEEDEELRGLLGKRNQSILAHGLEPISQPDYAKLKDKVVDLAALVIPNLEGLRARAAFPRFAV